MTNEISPEIERHIKSLNLAEKSKEELAEIANALNTLANKKRHNYIDFLFPDKGPLRRELYSKHIAFFNASLDYKERAFIAANRVGKTLAGAYEMVMHLTGRYPNWWKGRKFDKPIYGWIAASTGDTIQQSIQRDLIGSFGDHGSGLIPKDCIAKDPSPWPGVNGAYKTYYVKHISGGISVLEMKTYNQGKDSFEAARVDVIMLDEECPLDIYVECQMRTLTTGGIVYLTFTPDNGITDTVLHFYEKRIGEPEKYVTTVGWADVPHISKKMAEDMLRTIPPHLRDVKSKGIPYQGSGAIYPVSEHDYVVEPFQIPKDWPRAFGFDPGWNKTAALWGAYDISSDCWYLYSEHYAGEQAATLHAKAIKGRGRWIPGVADPYTEYGSKGKDGVGFLPAYEDEGLNLMMANNKDKEGGIFAVYERLSTGRLKVFSSLRNFLYEIRMYRRDDKGKIVKKHDHLMDCMQYLIRHGLEVAITEPNPADEVYIPPGSDRNPITGY